MPFRLLSLNLFLALLPFTLWAQNPDYQDDKDFGPPRSNRFADNRENGMLLLSVGPAIPLGDFADDSFTNNDAGFASTGFDIHVSFGRNWLPYLGMQTNIGFTKTYVKEDRVLDLYRIAYSGQGYDVTELNYSGLSQVYFNSGLRVTVPLQPIRIDLRMQIGLTFGIDNELTATLEDGSGSYQLLFERAVDFNWAPQLGLTFRVPLGDNLVASLSTDYRYAYFEYTDVGVYFANTFQGSESYAQATHVLTVDLGVGWAF